MHAEAVQLLQRVQAILPENDEWFDKEHHLNPRRQIFL